MKAEHKSATLRTSFPNPTTPPRCVGICSISPQAPSRAQRVSLMARWESSPGWGRWSLAISYFTIHPRWLSGKASTCQCTRHKRWGFDPWGQKIPWRRKWQPTPVFLPGKSHGQRSIMGYSPWGCKESDTTEWLRARVHTHTHTHTHTYFLKGLNCRYVQRFKHLWKPWAAKKSQISTIIL